MATDQEQTERGASTVIGTTGDPVYLATQVFAHRLTQDEAEIERLRADLERLTAKRDQLRARFESACELLERMQAHLDRTGLARLGESYVDTVLPRLIAERDAMREALLKIEEIASRPSIADEERMSMVWQIVVLSLDATRKATADATEEGK